MPELLDLPLSSASLPSFTPLADARKDGFTQARKTVFLLALRKAKGNMPQAAELSGVAFSTVYSHLLSDPLFKLQTELIKRELAGKLVKTAYIVGKRAESSGHADRKMLLRAWLPEEFGDKPGVSITFDLSSLTQQNGATIPGLTIHEQTS